MADIGQLVGDYQVLAQLGAGGMGRVYKVRNVISNREEAMKILLPDFASDADLAARFMAEIRTLATLEHPGIAQLRTAFQANNQFVMVMEYVEGTTLERLAAATRIPVDRVLDYAGQVLEALSYAHSRGVVHRDIKPANIMITTHGLVKLMDFGIAKSTDDMQLTRPGTTMGSVYYMSPEQVRGGTIDARSDLYSFGVTLYEMMTGRKPFQADTSYSVLNAQLNEIPTPPVEVNPLISHPLNGIILRALAKSPDQRFQSASEFRDALRELRDVSAPSFAPARIATTLEIPIAPPSATILAAPNSGTVAAIPPYEATMLAPPRGSTNPPLSGNPPPSSQTPPPSAAWTPVASQSAPGYVPPPAGAPARVVPLGRGGKSNRGLWIGLGAVTAILALAAVATVLPRMFSTHAGQKAAATDTQTASPTTGGTAAVATAPVATAPAANQPTGTTPAGTDPASATSVAASATAPAGAAPMTATSAPGAQPHAPRQPYVPKPTDGSAMKPGATASVSAVASAPPAASANAGASAKEVRDARDRYSNLEARADAAKAGVQQVRSQQQASGLDIRGDILAAMNRMQNHMRDAQGAIAQGDVASAGEYMDHAESDIATLEKFLGR